MAGHADLAGVRDLLLLRGLDAHRRTSSSHAGEQDWVYALAVVVRIAGQLYLVALVVRDILQPWKDPVRADGLSDDPLGGVLDEGIDAAPFRRPVLTQPSTTIPRMPAA